MSKATLPRGRMSSYCWAESAGGTMHCCLPVGHTGPHYHPYTRRHF
jgi:hypothetical protein